MINVAFLLLVFFLMAAVIVPPDPFDVTPPDTEAKADDPAETTLFVSADGDLAFGPHRGEAVFDAVSSGSVRIRADANLSASLLARIIARLQAAGVTSIEIATLPN